MCNKFAEKERSVSTCKKHGEINGKRREGVMLAVGGEGRKGDHVGGRSPFFYPCVVKFLLLPSHFPPFLFLSLQPRHILESEVDECACIVTYM